MTEWLGAGMTWRIFTHICNLVLAVGWDISRVYSSEHIHMASSCRCLGSLTPRWPQGCQISFTAIQGSKCECSRKQSRSCTTFYNLTLYVTSTSFCRLQVSHEDHIRFKGKGYGPHIWMGGVPKLHCIFILPQGRKCVLVISESLPSTMGHGME